MKKVIILIIIAILLNIVSQAEAVTIFSDIAHSANQLGAFTAELTYLPGTNTTEQQQGSPGLLTLEITNTNDPADLGAITAIAFNNPGGYIEDVSVTSDDLYDGDVFNLLFKNDLLEAKPYGSFDVALFTAETNGANKKQNILGGKTSAGIRPGETERFLFTLSGANIAAITSVDDFINEYSTGGNSSTFFWVRFQGFSEDGGGEGSDKVPGTVVPEPATLILSSLGMLAAGFFQRKQK